MSPGSIEYDDETYNLNTGSGHPDFLVYSPWMDLKKYAGLNANFTMEIYFENLDSGGEEIFISAYKAPTPVPEPASLAFVGLGVLILAIRQNSRKRFF